MLIPPTVKLAILKMFCSDSSILNIYCLLYILFTDFNTNSDKVKILHILSVYQVVLSSTFRLLTFKQISIQFLYRRILCLVLLLMKDHSYISSNAFTVCFSFQKNIIWRVSLNILQYHRTQCLCICLYFSSLKLIIT